MGRRTDKVYPGAIFGEWEVLEYIGKSKWLCQCSCGKTKEILTGKLTTGQTKSCGHTKLIDLTGQTFGEWTVLEYAGNMKWKCRCSCGKEKVINGRHLRDGVSSDCGHNGNKKLIDLTGKQIGEFTVLEYAGEKAWKCQCSCGKIKIIQGYRLRNGEVTSCGHTNRLTELSGKRFNKLVVGEYIGNRKYRCTCDCGNTVEVMTCNLLNGSTNSCGCLRKTIYTKEFILEKIESFVLNYKVRPFKEELAQYIGVSTAYIIYLCRKYDLSNQLFNESFGSFGEKQLYETLLQLNNNLEIELHNRKVAPGIELDIYIPNLKLAIEYNGDYWHQSPFRDKLYHQNKTIQCAKHGIRLIHIFEHEWLCEETHDKICTMLKNIVCNNQIIYARKCKVKVVDNQTEKEFNQRYHLQGHAQSTIAYGLYLDNSLISIMSFGKPRFNSTYSWEMVRYCVADSFNIIGGANKLFKAFIRQFNPDSIVSYCDISKFTGGIYTRLGFKATTNDITEPNYKWVKQNFKDSADILSRYQTQKQKLLDKGLGDYGNTEDEIMTNLGYMKVYDCGNLKFSWYREDSN